MNARESSSSRLGLVIDLDRCTGCGACAVACAIENNVPPAAATATVRTGLTWLRVVRVDNDRPFPETRSVFVPIMCQHCGTHTPCMAVCPQQAVDVDPVTGVVSQIPERCLGCRYCMAACPYHARVFNWTDPRWPAGSERALNPDVGVRMRGTVEKCNLCHGRRHAALERAAAAGRHDASPSEWTPACGACPDHAALADRPGRWGLARPAVAGVGVAADRLYHRGHAWAQPETDGTWSIGVDELADRVLAAPDAVRLPPPGTRLVANGVAWTARCGRDEVRVLAPIDGEVVATGSREAGWYLRVRPRPGGPDTRHLLAGDEARAWTADEVQRLLLSVRDSALGRALADGGRPASDLPKAAPGLDWQALRGLLLLNP